MGVATRNSCNLYSDKLPFGWKTITARGAKNKETTYFISPDGKRFLTMEAAKTHISEILFSQEELSAKRKRKRDIEELEEEIKHLRKAKRGKFAEGVINNNSDSESEKEDEDLKISPEIKRRRKTMAMRSPFRNLLKKTLKRTHAKNIRTEMLKAEIKPKIVKSPVKNGTIFAKKSLPSQC